MSVFCSKGVSHIRRSFEEINKEAFAPRASCTWLPVNFCRYTSNQVPSISLPETSRYILLHTHSCSCFYAGTTNIVCHINPSPVLSPSEHLPAMCFYDTSDLPLSFSRKFHVDPIVIPSPAIPSLSSMSADGNNGGTRARASPAGVATAAQALEVARDSEEGARDPNIINILESAVRETWAKIQAQPASYVMTRDEFAIFNYFQDRFAGQGLAVAARRRFWDSLELTNGA